MADSHDMRVIALKCPNCGGALKVPPGIDRTPCEHCGSTVLVVGARTGDDRSDATRPDTQEAAAGLRVVKIALWGTAISFALPIVATVIVIIAVVFIVLGIVLFSVAQ